MSCDSNLILASVFYVGSIVDPDNKILRAGTWWWLFLAFIDLLHYAIVRMK